VIVATDDIKIKSLVEQHGIEVWFSKKKFLNGTHRIACLCKEYGFNKNDNVINIQGDEFNFSLKGVKDLITKLSSSKSKGIFTLISKSRSKEIFHNPDHVKVLIDKKGDALFFSRSPVPFNGSDDHFIHIGIYGYKVSMLYSYLNFDKSPYEAYENLEQLRFIWNKTPIHCIKIKVNNSISINSVNDLKLAKETFK
jgi:CMP-2-keto-3-deoxyoctulosonic acid synthetase